MYSFLDDWKSREKLGLVMEEKKVRAWSKLGIDIRREEQERLQEYLKNGNKKQQIAAKVILDWGNGASMSSTSRDLSIHRNTVKLWREAFKAKGMACMSEGKGRSDLQTMATTLLDSPESLDNETLIRLTLAHVSQLQPDKSPANQGQGKLINECLSILQRCIDKKEKRNNIDSLGEALTEAMGNGS